MPIYLSPQFKVYDFSYIPLFLHQIRVHYEQRYHLPVGLFGQLIERCTDIAEVMGSNPSQA